MKTSAARGLGAFAAAQCLRMSTDVQDFSIAYQRSTIEQYAGAHGIGAGLRGVGDGLLFASLDRLAKAMLSVEQRGG